MGNRVLARRREPRGRGRAAEAASRRVKLFFVSAWATRSILGMSVGRGGVQIIPVLEGLPEGVDVQAVRYSESGTASSSAWPTTRSRRSGTPSRYPRFMA
jgi:hypothetical protein